MFKRPISPLLWALIGILLVALITGILISNSLRQASPQSPTTTEPTQSSDAPTQPSSAPTEPEPTGSEPTESEPTEPEPTEPEPTEPEPTEPEPTEPEPTEPEPTEPEPTEPEPTEPEPTEPEPTEPEEPILPMEPEPEEPRVEIVFGDPAPDPWADYPDGIRIETVKKTYFVAHVMLIKDPSAVYMATSSDKFSLDTPGTRITNEIVTQGAIAGINAGAFNDDGTSNTYVGSIPYGLVVSEGEIVWNDGLSYYGFVGMTNDNKLYVSDKISAATVKELGIRDGCCFGPVLIKDGQPNQKIYSSTETARNSRTAIGQRADGTIIFLCIDGRQPGSLGALPGDVLDLMIELGAVNACTLDGGASTSMVYKDTYGLYGTPGNIVMCSSYYLFQAMPRRMPTFFMVRAPKTEE